MEFTLHSLQEILHWKYFKKYFTNSVFNIHNPIGIQLLTRLRLGSNHLNEHKFDHKFQNCTNPRYICSSENKSTTHFFLHCHFYIPVRATFFNKLKEIGNDLQELSDQTENCYMAVLIFSLSLLTILKKYIVRKNIFHHQ